MGVRECVVRGRANSEHVCQFFDADESRNECVGGFLLEGYQAGDYLIVIARASNWAGIMDYLEGKDVPVANAVEEGRIVFRDAKETLVRLCPNGSPSASAFQEIIGTLVRQTSERGRVRAYGEMVDILAQRGDMADVLKLEDLWNDLSERVPLSLMCGYAAAHFVSPGTHGCLRDVCSAHTRVDRSSQDPLAAWLLTAAHNTSSSLLSN